VTETPHEYPEHSHSPNGTALRQNAGKLIGTAAGKAVAAELGPALASTFSQVMQFLPQMISQGVAQALSQVPVRTRRLCAKCLAARITWEVGHKADMDQALSAAAAAAGIIEPGTSMDVSDPRAGQLDVAPFLPDSLRPGAPGGMPQIMDAVTMAAGDEVCPMHLPGTPQEPGRRQILVAPAGMTASMAARLAAQAA
jgi:hypothetical protein